MKNTLAAALLAAMTSVSTLAQTPSPASRDADSDGLLSLRGEVRLDWQQDRLDGHINQDNTGFEGKFINLRADGRIAEGLTYSWRQRLNRGHGDASFFDATDWIYLNYLTGAWEVSGGKQVVAIGGWEYDRAPIDLYGCSVFWNNIPCYEIGISGAWHPGTGDKFMVQVCESPFFTPEQRNMYAWNLFWQGTHGAYSSLWSANMIEYLPGKYISYLALGNKVDIGKTSLEIDLMNRAASHQAFMLKDVSVMAELSWHPCSKCNVWGKATYDRNISGTDADMCVLDGTRLKMIGAGGEFMPLHNARQALRFHADCFYSWGCNANRANVMQGRTLLIDVGVKWNIDLLTLACARK